MPKTIQMLVKFKRNGHVCPGFLFIGTPCTSVPPCLSSADYGAEKAPLTLWPKLAG